MTFFYFLPLLIAIAFVVAHLARGGKLGGRAGARSVTIGIVAVAALAAVGLVIAELAH